MSKVSNTIKMLEILSDGQKHSLSDLADALEVSKRMVRVYKEDLEKCGIFIESIKGLGGGYILEEKKDFPKVITDYDLLSLRKAIKNRQKCLIFYDNTQRIIHPYKMSIIDDKVYLLAYCELRKSLRTFPLEEIKNVEVLKEIY